jgi:DNA-binding response OmpR family regulator
MRILLVEDSQRLQKSIGKALRKSGYTIDISGNGEDGLWLAETNDYDAIILDIMLPKLDGLTLLRRLRKGGRKAGVLLLTAKDTVEDRVGGLQMGADDYLVKPFALEELLARVQVLCRRQYGNATNRITLDDLEIDLNARCAVRAGQPLKLNAREFMLLEYLAQRRGQIVSRSEIETHIYNDESELMSNVVDSAVCVLRRKLALPGRPQMIHTRRGMGYVLQPPK